MEFKPAYAVAALIIIFAALFFIGSGAPPKQEDKTQIAKQLFMKAVSLGENTSSYQYSYMETNDGFPENYTLSSDGVNSAVAIDSPLSNKKIYFMQNDTILCITYLKNQSCSSVADVNETKRYVSYMKNRLFDKDRISAAMLDNEYKINHSIMVFSPTMIEKQLLGGKACTEISFAIDYSNITLQEMSRFGIAQGSPTYFEGKECINNETGVIYEYNFNYTFPGKVHEFGFLLNGIDFIYKTPVTPPELAGDAVSAMYDESSYKRDLMACYLKAGEEKEKCIALLAQELKSKELCGYVGMRRDRCLVSLIPVSGDSTICPTILTAEFKDDCYIEMAGFSKNESWCSQVQDSTKNRFCLNVSQPAPPALPNENTTVEEPAANNTEPMPEKVQAIFDGLDNSTTIGTNVTNETTGSE